MCVHDRHQRVETSRNGPIHHHTMIATINIATGAKLDTRLIGLKVTSAAGDMENDGDHDDSPEWAEICWIPMNSL